MKGIAILLVILGHSFCHVPMNLQASFPELYAWVCSFQTPLFFIASGFLFSVAVDFKLFLRKKLLRLIVPFVAFSLVAAGMKFLFGSFTASGSFPFSDMLRVAWRDHYYWFLYVLFFIMVLTLLLRRSLAFCVAAVASVVVSTYTDVLDKDFLLTGRIVYYLPFFLSGLLFRSCYEKVLRLSVPKWWVVLLGSMAIYITAMLYSPDKGILRQYLLPLSSSLTVWLVVLRLLKRLSLPAMRHFGHYSLQYYLNHLLVVLPCSYVSAWIFTIPLVRLLAIWLMAIFISWLMLKLELRFPLTRFCSGMASHSELK